MTGSKRRQDGNHRPKNPFAEDFQSRRIVAADQTRQLHHLRFMSKRAAKRRAERDISELQELKIFHNHYTRQTHLDPIMKSQFGRRLHRNVKEAFLDNNIIGGRVKIPDTSRATTRYLINQIYIPPNSPLKTSAQEALLCSRSGIDDTKSEESESPTPPSPLEKITLAQSSKFADFHQHQDHRFERLSLLDDMKTMFQEGVKAKRKASILESRRASLRRRDLGADLQDADYAISFLTPLMEKVTEPRTLEKVFGLIDLNSDHFVTENEISAVIDKYKIPAPASRIYSWLTGHQSDVRGVTKENFQQKGAPYYSIGGTIRDPAKTTTLELKAAQLGQRLSRPFRYYKIRHPLTEYKEEEASEVKPISARSSPVSEDLADRVKKLRKRGGTLIFTKKEAKEVREQIDFFVLDGCPTQPKGQGCETRQELRQELRSKYIRLSLYPNQKNRVDSVAVEPTIVFWRMMDIRDMQSFCAKASVLTAVSHVYNPLLRRLRGVEELHDGGSYLLTGGEPIEFPLPAGFQEERDIMERVHAHHKKIAEECRKFFSTSTCCVFPCADGDYAVSGSRGGLVSSHSAQMNLDSSIFDHQCSQLLKGARNRRYKPSEWVSILTSLGIFDVTEDFFRWLSRESALTIDQLLEALDRPSTRQECERRLVPVKRTNDPTSFGSATLTNLMVQLFPNRRGSAGISLGNVVQELEKNKLRMEKARYNTVSVMIEDGNLPKQSKKSLRLPRIAV